MRSFQVAVRRHEEDFPDAAVVKAAEAPEAGGEHIPVFASITEVEESGGDDGVVNSAFDRGRDRAVLEDVTQLGKGSRG